MLPSPRYGLAPEPKADIGLSVNVVAALAEKAATEMRISARKRVRIFIGLWFE